jgi:hypothetical protein
MSDYLLKNIEVFTDVGKKSANIVSTRVIDDANSKITFLLKRIIGSQCIKTLETNESIKIEFDDVECPCGIPREVNATIIDTECCPTGYTTISSGATFSVNTLLIGTKNPTCIFSPAIINTHYTITGYSLGCFNCISQTNLCIDPSFIC